MVAKEQERLSIPAKSNLMDQSFGKWEEKKVLLSDGWVWVFVLLMIFDGSVTLPGESTAFAGSDLEITASEDGAPSVDYDIQMIDIQKAAEQDKMILHQYILSPITAVMMNLPAENWFLL